MDDFLSPLAHLLAGLLVATAFGAATAAPLNRSVVASARHKPSTVPRSLTTAAPTPPLVTVIAAGPGQAGYVHFFEIRGPDGIAQAHVGIELADQRIAWSFPVAGVSVSPFVASGTLSVGGETWTIEHRFGIRPFTDERSMRALQHALDARVSPWIDDATGHCDPEPAASRECVSCLGFVVRVLYPASYRHFVALPSDFRRAADGSVSTEDLLLYLTGMQQLPNREARVKRLAQLTLPLALRDELARVIGNDAAVDLADNASAPRLPRRAARLPARKSARQL